jgi:NMD protein affecting ribosome stability and mRNA decay
MSMKGERRGDVGHESKSPYWERRKYPEPTVCTRCGLVYQDGRWAEGMAIKGANKELCPACRRITDRYPGGVVYLSGSYLKDKEKEEEILNIARNQEEQARRQRPLQRIMWINKNKDGIEIATTNEHLARRIGKSINAAHAGALEIKQLEGERFVRVYWQRS